MEAFNKFNEKYSLGGEYVFKSCSREWIVVLKKLEDTKTNESRVDVKDSLYAKFRADKLLVVDIVHKFFDQTIDEITNSAYSNKTIKYKKGEIIEVFNFDKDLDAVCAPGIHYFKSAKAAIYYELIIENGPNKSWHENGQLHIECAYKNGKEDGLYKEWYANGQLEEECTFKDGKKNGLQKKWYNNGQLEEGCTFKDGKKNGLLKKWYGNGQLWEESIYKDDKLDGEFKKWYRNGQLMGECTYKDRNIHGLYRVWYDNGQLRGEYTYKDGVKNGSYKEWNTDGKLQSKGTYKDGKK
jgi:antitoxin component YwqK of YwqJK toxin-antitoxin module